MSTSKGLYDGLEFSSEAVKNRVNEFQLESQERLEEKRRDRELNRDPAIEKYYMSRLLILFFLFYTTFFK